MLRWRLEPRADEAPRTRFRLLAILVALALGLGISGLLARPDASPYRSIFNATIGSQRGISTMIALAMPLVLTGLAVAVGRRMGLWNVGGEGQYFMGAWGGTAVAFAWPDLPGPLLLPLMVLAGCLGGAVWILIPALARAYLHVSEILTTLMLNFVALLWLAYWTTGTQWRNPLSAGSVLSSRPLPDQASLPRIEVADVTFSSGILIGILATAILWFLFRHTSFGFMTTMAGQSERTGVYAGMRVKSLTMTVLLISGAIAGLAGVVQMVGTDIQRFSTTLSNNTGYLGIAVGAMAGGSFTGVVAAAFLLAAITSSGNALRLAGVTPELAVFGLTGFILLATAISQGAAGLRLAQISETEASPKGEAVSTSHVTLNPERDGDDKR